MLGIFTKKSKGSILLDQSEYKDLLGLNFVDSDRSVLLDQSEYKEVVGSTLVDLNKSMQKVFLIGSAGTGKTVYIKNALKNYSGKCIAFGEHNDYKDYENVEHYGIEKSSDFEKVLKDHMDLTEEEQSKVVLIIEDIRLLNVNSLFDLLSLSHSNIIISTQFEFEGIVGCLNNTMNVFFRNVDYETAETLSNYAGYGTIIKRFLGRKYCKSTEKAFTSSDLMNLSNNEYYFSINSKIWTTGKNIVGEN